MQVTEQTSSQNDGHLHISKVVEWSYELIDGDMKQRASLYGCTDCDATSAEPFKWEDEASTDHTQCGDDCFSCKIRTLEMNAGDAKHSIVASGTTQKKWDKELAFYKEARAQGVQPEGTSRSAVQKALEASEVLNKPYNGGKMPKANTINNKTVEVMKEIGAV
jgi:hypothetical protein